MARPRSASRRSDGVLLTLSLVAVLSAACSENEAPDDEITPARAAQIARIVPVREALAGAHIPTLDPAVMNEAEIEKALGTGPRCQFRYTSAGKPVLALRAAPDGEAGVGVVKLNGSLIVLPAEPVDGRIVLGAEAVRLTLSPDGGINAAAEEHRQEADLVFEVGSSLRAGYRGYYECVE